MMPVIKCNCPACSKIIKVDFRQGDSPRKIAQCYYCLEYFIIELPIKLKTVSGEVLHGST